MLIEQSDIIEKIKSSGISVLEIARKTGINPQRIYKFVSGRNNADYKDLVVLDKFFNNELGEPEAKYGELSLQNKYIRSLEEQIQLLKTQIEFLSSNIEASLNLIGQGQAVQLAHLKALEWYLTREVAGKNEKKHQAELEVLGKMLSMFSNQNPEKGSS